AVAEWKVDEPLGFESDELATAVPLIPDIRRHSRDAASMAGLKRLLDEVPVAIARIPGKADDREADGVEVRLRAAGIRVEFSGRIADELGELGWTAVLSNNKTPIFEPAPPDFKVTALIAAYNEADVVRQTITALIEQGVDVYFIDNWSNDGTYEIVQEFLGKGVVGLERFPAGSPSPTYDWTDLLRRKEELCRTFSSSWFIHFDADELRESPWPGVSLRDAFWRVDREGFNAVDHTVLDFRPVAAETQALVDFDRFELRAPLMPRAQVKAWKNVGKPVDLATTGGHAIEFEGRRIYPYYFLLRHYPLRSQEQAARKVFAERKSRWNAEERARGWHFQYDHFKEGHQFAWKSDELLAFDGTFYREYLVERLSGIGIKARNEQHALEKSLPKLASRLDAANVSGEKLLAAFTNPEDPLSAAEFRILRMNIDRSRQSGENDRATLLENLMLLAANSKPEVVAAREPATAGA
ncbi:MAG TPA: glycosyltransferase family 2 protein, partial [Polyangiaceae bacterium]